MLQGILGVAIGVQQSMAMHMYGSINHCSSKGGIAGGTFSVGNCVNYTRRALALYLEPMALTGHYADKLTRSTRTIDRGAAAGAQNPSHP